MWRIIDISGEGYTLRIKNKNLQISKESSPGISTSICLDDINSIITHGNRNMFSEELLSALSENCIPLTICDEKHLPKGMLLSYKGNIDSAKKEEKQYLCSLPRKKQAWAIIIKAKVEAQMKLLYDTLHRREAFFLKENIKRIKSGDSTNIEAQSASVYFKALFGSHFKRKDEDENTNALLNYAYTIIRSLIARSIVSHGLNPSISIYHSNRINSFALADDLMEPLRPIADRKVLEILSDNDKAELTPEIKKELINLLKTPVNINKETYELSEACNKYIVNYYQYIERTSNSIDYPKELVDNADRSI